MLVQASEQLYIAALLYAGPEPQERDFRRGTSRDGMEMMLWGAYDQAHQSWQLKLAEILMRGWDDHARGREGIMCRDVVQRGRLSGFYAWLCKQRGEPWEDDGQFNEFDLANVPR